MSEGSREGPGIKAPILFFVALAFLGFGKVLLQQVRFPDSVVGPLTFLVTALFIAVPVFALYWAASYPWTRMFAALTVVTGVLIHAGMQLLSMNVLGGQGLGASFAMSARDVGLMIWCAGLGALLSTLIKDKNLLIPVSIFLAAFDFFLVLTPVGPVKQVLERAPQIVQSVALNVPAPSAAPTGSVAMPFALVGAADFVFMAMFFIALFKFSMRARATAIALVPAIGLYLLLALVVRNLPLLVPIAVTVLAVNFKEFKLSKEEWASTGVVALIVGGLVWWGATRPKPQAAPSPPGAFQESRE